jgi:uncharacterized protein
MKRVCLSLGAVAALSIATAASGADYAPIDCAKADTPSLHAICRNYSLGQAEARMATLFGIATSLVAMGRRGALIDTQREWLRIRDMCGGDVACLSNAYARRIRELDAVIADIASRGPY